MFLKWHSMPCPSPLEQGRVEQERLSTQSKLLVVAQSVVAQPPPPHRALVAR
jgi:hypothetical protein